MGREGAPSKQGIGWQGAIAKRMRRYPGKQERKKNKDIKVGAEDVKWKEKSTRMRGVTKSLTENMMHGNGNLRGSYCEGGLDEE